MPSTHLFIYPDLGIATLNGFAAEQEGSRGVQVATLVNPETTPAPEIDAAARILSDQRLFVRVYQGSGADVTSISEMIELFPYDLMIIATHCGDAPGYRWTYEFTDSEGIPSDAEHLFCSRKGASIGSFKVGFNRLLMEAGILYGSDGKRRVPYSLRHTYATMRISEGVSVFQLAANMGTSVEMIDDFYGKKRMRDPKMATELTKMHSF